MQFLDTSDLRNDKIYLQLCRTSQAIPAKGYVPAYCFEICETETGIPVGRCDLRVGDNENLYYGGHIGYAVEPEFQGHHYAAQACKLLFALAKRHGMERVYLTCHPDNKASQRTCELAGAEFVQLVDLPPHHDLYLRGVRQECQYRYDLSEPVLRLARWEDLPAVAALYDAVNDYLENNVNYSGWAKGRYPTLKTAEKALEARSLYVYLDGDKIAGTVILDTHQPEAYKEAHWKQELPDGKALVIHTLAVHPAFFKRGIGKKLIGLAEESARRQNLLAVRLNTFIKNIPAARMYRSMGYQEAGIVDLRLGIPGQTEYICFEKRLDKKPAEEE